MERVYRLIAFGTSSAIWLVGFDLLGHNSPVSTAWVPPMAFAVFLFGGAVVVGLSRAWFGALLGLWAVGVVLFVVHMVKPPPEFPVQWLGPIIFSLIYVTIAFAAWVATAGAIWVLLSGGRAQSLDHNRG